MGDKPQRLLSVRVSPEDYECVRTYAFLARTSMNDVVVRSIRAFLADQTRELGR